MTFMVTGKFRGDRLREYRTAKGWSQSKLARKIGAHVTSISDWERGDNAPSGRHVASLSRELGVPVEKFYGDAADEEDRAAMPSMLEALYAALGQALRKVPA